MNEITINDMPSISAKTGEKIPESLRVSALTDIALRRIMDQLYWPSQYAKCYQCDNRIPEYDACKLVMQPCKMLKICTSYKPTSTQN